MKTLWELLITVIFQWQTRTLEANTRCTYCQTTLSWAIGCLVTTENPGESGGGTSPLTRTRGSWWSRAPASGSASASPMSVRRRPRRLSTETPASTTSTPSRSIKEAAPRSLDTEVRPAKIQRYNEPGELIKRVDKTCRRLFPYTENGSQETRKVWACASNILGKT